MKIAYLILAHSNPRHFGRLISALSSGSCAFFVHIDSKSNIEDFLRAEGTDVHFVERRIPVYWGDFSQVEALLILLRAALADSRHFDRFVLLSGTDYALQPTSRIEYFFARNRSAEFINLVQMPSSAAGKPMSRLTTYKERPGDMRPIKAIRSVLSSLGIVSRTRDYKAYLGALVPYAGSTWWALSREACEHINAFATNELRIVEFFKHTHCPDESFFQTILGNSRFKPRIRRNLTYADWTAGGPSPAYIGSRHLPFFRCTSSFPPSDIFGAGDILFARKFSDDADSVVSQIDQLLEIRACEPNNDLLMGLDDDTAEPRVPSGGRIR